MTLIYPYLFSILCKITPPAKSYEQSSSDIFYYPKVYSTQYCYNNKCVDIWKKISHNKINKKSWGFEDKCKNTGHWMTRLRQIIWVFLIHILLFYCIKGLWSVDLLFQLRILWVFWKSWFLIGIWLNFLILIWLRELFFIIHEFINELILNYK
jgi:hypothetical protein